MDRDGFYLSILTGIISGLVVLMSSFIGELTDKIWLKFAIVISTPFLLFAILIKLLDKQFKDKKKI